MIMVAPNGARKSKQDHHALPITLSEILETALSCHAAGANALHLHVRDDKGAHSLDSGLYNEALRELAIRVPDMTVQITTEANGTYSVEQQLSCLKNTQTSWASISIREISRSPDLAERVYKTCINRGIRVQHILYDADDANLLSHWQTAGWILPQQNSVLLVLGRYTKNQISDVATLTPFLNSLPGVSDWTLCAFGPQEHECLIEATKLGGHCRVGFENSLVNGDGKLWKDNASSVKTLAQALKQL